MSHRPTIALLTFLVGGASAAASTAVDYARDIRPLFRNHCQSCHGPVKQKGGLRLDSGAAIHSGGKHGSVINLNAPANSSILVRIAATDESERMPPKGSRLTEDQIDLIRRWIDQGSQFPNDERSPVSPEEHWAFQPVERPNLPSIADRTWPRNPIDRFVLARLEARGWKPAERAPATALFRRVYLGLLGIPPSLEEQQAFARAPTPESLNRIIDQLLTRPGYGERWARHWLDLVRYAETNGYERDAIKPMVWRYRDYVIRALNNDKPYDRFLHEQLAGDELPDATSETMIATGFYRLGHWDDEPADPQTDRFDQLDDIINTTSQSLLGLTLACARCHDHKFEPLSSKDYYSLLAVFDPLSRPRRGRTELTIPAGSRAQLKALAKRDSQIAELNLKAATLRADSLALFLKTGKTGLADNSLKAFQTPVKQRDPIQRNLVKANQPKLDQAHARWASNEFKARIAEITKQIADLKRRTPDQPQAYVLQERSPKAPETRILIRGNATRPGDPVAPAAPDILVKRSLPAFPSPDSHTTRRRLGLAHWIGDEGNPLTARVIVNHVWRLHFGQGLVRTAGDFGLMGEPPTHPELLDWLAHWFMHNANWSLKQLHRLILNSSTWRMSRERNEACAAEDPDNRLLWRMPYRRLEVEAIRDSMLAVSGQINRAMFGPSMYPAVPPQALEGHSDPEKIWKSFDEEDASRRTVYAFIKRSMVVPMLEVLDLCDTTRPSDGRAVTTVATQALTLFNGDFVNRQARHFANRLRREAGHDRHAQIERAYRLALCREPTEAETEAALAFLANEATKIQHESGSKESALPKRQALTQLCRVLLNLNEFAYPE